MDQQVNQQQNTVFLEQLIYASPEKFTPTLLVMLEIFRRSDGALRQGQKEEEEKPVKLSKKSHQK